MFTLTIQVASLEELESFIASLRHSAPQRLVAEVTRAADEAGASEFSKQQDDVPDQEDDGLRSGHDALVAEYTELFGKPPRSNAKTETIQRRIDAEKSKRAKQAQEPPHEESSSEPTMDDAREALKSVSEGPGMDAAFGVLKEFGAMRVSELTPAQYPEFIEACKQAL